MRPFWHRSPRNRARKSLQTLPARATLAVAQGLDKDVRNASHWGLQLPTLTPNIENRVRKLPKPSNATQSLQPLFEAVSNAMFGIEDRYENDVARGRIDITVTKLADPRGIEIVIADDGIGLDADRYAAFCEIDTDFKKSKGGKGVGRLFWLDAFDQIEVDSTYGLDRGIAERAFAFVLNNTEQVVPTAEDKAAEPQTDTGTRVRFRGIRTKEYADPFPKRADTFPPRTDASLVHLSDEHPRGRSV